MFHKLIDSKVDGISAPLQQTAAEFKAMFHRVYDTWEALAEVLTELESLDKDEAQQYAAEAKAFVNVAALPLMTVSYAMLAQFDFDKAKRVLEVELAYMNQCEAEGLCGKEVS